MYEGDEGDNCVTHADLVVRGIGKQAVFGAKVANTRIPPTE